MKLSDLVNKISEDLVLDTSQAIEADTELLMSGIVDSLGVVNLVAWIEHELDVEIDPGDVVIENFETPAAILGFVDQLVGSGQPG